MEGRNLTWRQSDLASTNGARSKHLSPSELFSMERENKAVFAVAMNSGMQDKCPMLCFLVRGGPGSGIQIWLQHLLVTWLSDFFPLKWRWPTSLWRCNERQMESICKGLACRECLRLFYYYTEILEARCLMKKKGLFSWQFWRPKVQTAWCQLWWITPCWLHCLLVDSIVVAVCERGISWTDRKPQSSTADRGLNLGVLCH